MTVSSRSVATWRIAWIVSTVAGGLVLIVTLTVHYGAWDLDAYRNVNLAAIYAPTADMSTQYAFRYSPPIALMMTPLALLPDAASSVLWLALQLAALWYIGRRWMLALVLFPPVGIDLAYGNIVILMAAAVMVGFRHASAWSFIVLTKVTPGIGLAWFAVRREWRPLGTAIGVSAAAMLAAELVLPGATRAWVESLVANTGASASGAYPVPLVVRLPLAFVVVAWGALTDRRWTVALSVALAMPVFWPVSWLPLIVPVAEWLRGSGRQAVAVDGEVKGAVIGIRSEAPQDAQPSRGI